MNEALPVALILLTSAVAVVVVFRLLSMPAIIGYLLVGALVGPNALALVADTQENRHLAEYGVVFLMFTVGLEFSLPQLVSMRRTVFGFGGAQVVITGAIAFGIAVATGLDWRAGVIVAGVFAMSSTAIVSKTLAERMQLHTPHGRQIMGVLLFQDIAVIPLLVLVPAFALSKGEVGMVLAVATLKAALVLVIVLVVGQRVMRPLFHLVARQKSSELFVLFVLLVVLACAWATEQAGLSLALGAFLAGMLISETEYRYQVEDYVKPFRDVMLGFFFVTIGMLVDWHAMLAYFGWIALVFVGLLLGKFVVIFGIGRALGNERPTTLRSAMALAPAGEFGFVLLALAQKDGLLSQSTFQVVLSASLLSMLVAPLVLGRMETIVLYFVESEWTQRALALHQLAVKSMASRGHVIVCGYGRSGQALSQFLEREGITTIALDADPERVRQAAAAGDSVVYGDAARREVMVAAAVSRASAVVITFADTPKALGILAHVHELRPELPVIVRTFDDSDVSRLKAAGAAEIVAEVIEGSLMLATQTMIQLGTPLNRVLRHLRDARAERYRSMRGFFPGATDEELNAGEHRRLRTLILGPDAGSIGRTLASLRLDSMGVDVTAIRRKGAREVNPKGDTTLMEGDVVVILGSAEALAKAEIRLLQG